MEYKDCQRKRSGRAFSHFSNIATLKKERHGPSSFQEILAERILLRRLYTGQRIIQNCPIPNSRTTFLIVFSPDGTKFASTNGNHNVYIISVTTKKILKTLSGHRRTPWTLAFHPSNNNILASGCLDGEIRVWNLENETCEVCWQSPGNTVIASLTFHPRTKILVVATHQDLYLWDWSTATVISHTSTGSAEEKIRYVKFDSSGDKLITAIALDTTNQPSSTTISYREVYRFTLEKDMLMDFQEIQKLLKALILRTSTSKTPDLAKLRISDHARATLPLCATHDCSFQDFLNVSVFCPTEFSLKIMAMLRSNTTPTANFCKSCCLCRYIWLYEAVFKCRLAENGEHAWNFTESRKQELMAENKDETNGLTEDMLRYCFERYARISIAPYFAKRIRGSVSTKCLAVSDPFSYSADSTSSTLRDVEQSTTKTGGRLRWYYFLNITESYNFQSKGCFKYFLTSFVSVYQFLSAFQRILTKEDYEKLNIILTECEYLYCKMLLICRVIEGDEEFLLRQPSDEQFESSSRKDERCTAPNDSPTKSHVLLPERYQREAYSSKVACNFEIQHFVSQNKNMTENRADSSSKTNSDCDLCNPLKFSNDSTTSLSLGRLQRELDTLMNAIACRYDAKTQNSRIRKLYAHEYCHIGSETSNVRATDFVNDVKKTISVRLCNAIKDLKVLLRTNLVVLPVGDRRFHESFIRMLVFITRKLVSFSNVVLEFLCNFDHKSRPAGSNILYKEMEYHVFSCLRLNRPFILNRENYSISDTAFDTLDLDFWDDELGVNTPEDLIMRYEFENRSKKAWCSNEINPRARKLSERGVIGSGIYLSKHVRLLELIDASQRNRIPSVLDAPQRIRIPSPLFNGPSLNMDEAGFCEHVSMEFRDRHRYNARHRLQMWDFSELKTPNISSREENVIITECKMHNDATIAISPDNTRVAALLSENQYTQMDWLGIFSLEWQTLGHILYGVPLNQIAVSLSFSPTSEHLAVGYWYTYRKDVKMADVIAAKRETWTWKTLNPLMKSLPVITSIIDTPNLSRQNVSTTVNCIKWLSEPGQGLVLGNSAGEIKFLY